MARMVSETYKRALARPGMKMKFWSAMKWNWLLLSGVLLLLVCSHTQAQTTYSASRSPFSLSVGGTASIFQPDYVGGLTEQKTGLGIQYGLIGVGTFVDVRFRRWVQIEGEGRWSNFNINEILATNSLGATIITTDVSESNYFIGPRIPLHHFRRFTPYAKGLIGIGRTHTNSDLLSNAGGFGGLAWAYGGGVDYKVSKRLSIRAFDVEYQNWNLSVRNTTTDHLYSFSVHPYGASAGVSYRIF